MSWALTILSLGKRGLSWLLGAIKAHPWQFALVAALALAWWQWSGKSEAIDQRDAAKASLATEKEGRKADRAEWDRKVAAAKAVTAAAERKSQEIAHNAQQTHDTLLADNAGLRSYIAAHRLRPGQSAGSPAGASQDHGAAVSDDATAGALVAVSEADLAACDASFVYAQSAYQWAQGLIIEGLATPK